MKKLLAALLCVMIFTLSSAQAAIFPKPTAAPITSVQLNQGITLDGQYIKIKSYKFSNTVKQTIGRKQYTWTADWGETYLLITVDWKNVSGSTIYSGFYSKGKKMLYINADYSTEYHPYTDRSKSSVFYSTLKKTNPPVTISILVVSKLSSCFNQKTGYQSPVLLIEKLLLCYTPIQPKESKKRKEQNNERIQKISLRYPCNNSAV